jgi:hypothetical protein
LVDHNRFQRERLQAPSAAELAAIRNLTQDLPALWQAATTTQSERQEIVRLLLERVIIKMVGETEQVNLECHWHGGNRTAHRIVRPVARITALSTYPALIARMTELHKAGHSTAQIADVLNADGRRPPKRRDTYNAAMVRNQLVVAGVVDRKRRKPRITTEREPDEWTVRELSAHIGIPQQTLYYWVQTGRIPYRRLRKGGNTFKLVFADAATIAELKAMRMRPTHIRRLPPPEGGAPLTRNGHLPVGLGRDAGGDAPLDQSSAEPVSVVTPVCEQRFRLGKTSIISAAPL